MQVYPYAASDENPDAKAAVDKEWKKLETIPVWQVDNVQSKKEVILAAQWDKKKSPFCHIDGHLSPQKRGIRTQITEIQRTGRTPWWRPRKTFGRRFKVTSFIVITLDLAFKSMRRRKRYAPKEETFPFPLRFFDVTRSTHTFLDVMQKKTYWRW